MSVGGLSAVPLFVLANVSKRFGLFWANRDVSLDVFEGEIHAVVGENGAGKSTLMKILYGHLQPDSGTIYLRGRPVVFRHPREAMASGIGMVHQQLLIFPQLSALENIVVGTEPGKWGCIDFKRAKDEVEQQCRLFGFELPLGLMAGELSFAQRQQIELLRILYKKAKVLILDEPTSLLAPPEIDRLLELLKSLRSKGHTIIFISHRLREVFAVADRISVLRRGRWAGTFEASKTSMEELARLIVPGEESISYAEAGAIRVPCGPEKSSGPATPILLEIKGILAKSLSHEVGLENFSLQIHEGEILGIGGIVGNGQRTLSRVLTGMIPVERGSIFFGGRDITRCAIRERLQSGIRWLPANPLEEMLLPARSVLDNFLLGRQRDPSFQSKGRLLDRKIKRWVEEELAAGEVSYFDTGQAVESLSGGNLQKLALARTLAGSPRLVILEQPARGLDLAAQEKLHRKVSALNATGVAFLMISYDLDELLALCHRIGIFFRGQLTGIVEREKALRDVLGRWMLGLKVRGESDEEGP